MLTIINHKRCIMMCIFLLIMPSIISFGQDKPQTINCSGRITEENGTPVIGAYILQEGTQNGTISDAYGNFSIMVPSGASLSISCIGYKNLTIAA